MYWIFIGLFVLFSSLLFLKPFLAWYLTNRELKQVRQNNQRT